MPKKLTFEEVKEFIEEKQFILLSKNYINNSQKLIIKNKEGYKTLISFSNLREGKNPIFFSKSNPYTIENIKLFLKKKKEGVSILSDSFEGNNKKLRFLCSCGETFERTWADLSTNVYSVCNKCVHNKIGNNKKKSYEEVERFFNEHGYKLLSKEYINNITPLQCENYLGYRGNLSYSALSSGKNISIFDTRSNLDFYIYNANHYAKLHNYTCIVEKISDTQNHTAKSIDCICECGNRFTTSINSFKSGKCRCEKCAKSISIYEEQIKNFLNKHKIRFEQQKRFKDCKDKICLPFDFFLIDYNICLEIDGQGHYFPAYFNQCSKEDAIKSYKIIKVHDEIKTNYCKTNNITLVRIPYWNMDNEKYVEILTNIIKD